MSTFTILVTFQQFFLGVFQLRSYFCTFLAHLGSHVGGLAITLTGEGLSDEATVTVCGEDCTNVQGSATELTCNVPPSVAGCK